MHDIAYILDQFQQSARGGWSAQEGAFFAWLNRFLVVTWSEAEQDQPPNGVAIPERPADGNWTDSVAEVPGEMRRMEWWHEGTEMIGLLRYAESADDAMLFSFYRVPCAALSFFRLAIWYGEQRPPECAQLHHPIVVLAAALLPDDQARNRGSALVQIGSFQYVLQLSRPGSPEGGERLLDNLPATFMPRRSLQAIPPDSYVNEQGFLCFEDPVQAMGWFLETTLQTGGWVLPLTELKEVLAAAEGETRPAFPDLEQVRRFQADLEQDASMGILTETERQERIAFMLQAVARIQRAFPPETLQALTRDIEGLLERVRARHQGSEPAPQEK